MTVKHRIPMTPSKRYQKDLIEQKYIDLTITYERMKLKPDITTKFADIIAIIEGRLDPEVEHSWDNANVIEQSLAPLYNEVELDSEINLNMLEAKRRLTGENSDFFDTEHQKLLNAEYLDEQAVKDGKLNLLCNLYKKLQVSYDLEVQKKHALSAIRVSTSVAFLLSIFMFFTMDNMRLLKLVMLVETNMKTEFIVSALSAGWMGACFSMLLGLKGNIQQQSLSALNAMNRIDNLISRSLIGSVSGLLIFYAFEASFLQGAMFPELVFNSAGVFISDDNTVNKAHATLVFWAFLAGFSEKFVPNLLTKAESKAEEGS